MKRRIVLLILVLLFAKNKAQVVYEHINNETIYSFLDELESAKAISINSVTKPYSRNFIFKKLEEAFKNDSLLTKRQKQEVEFYLVNFGYGRNSSTENIQNPKILNGDGPFSIKLNPVALSYKKDGVIAFGRPIAGLEYFSNTNGTFYSKFVGAGGSLEVGNNFGMYFTLIDNSENAQLTDPEFLQQRRGAPVRVFVKDHTYSEIHGGVTYNWKWGSIGIVKDHIEWGPNYHGSNILSSSTNPSFPMLKFDINPTKWMAFHYVHGFLSSGIFDSLYVDGKGSTREYAEPRYLVANMLELKPWSHTNISLGNSLIYGSTGINMGFLNPILFYRPADYQSSSFNDNAGTNGQMFLTISTRYLKFMHFYTSIFIDELSVSEMFSKTDNHNQISFKAGIKNSGLLKNTSITFEYTRNNPWTYNHFQEITLLETNQYNLGHYLRENAQEIFVSARYNPIRGLSFYAYYNKATKGPEATQGIYSGLPFLEKTTWTKQDLGIKAHYEIVNNVFVFAKFIVSNVTGEEEFMNKYTPAVFHGKTKTASSGFAIGF